MAPKDARARKKKQRSGRSARREGVNAPRLGSAMLPRGFWRLLLLPGIALVAGGVIMAAVYSVAFVNRMDAPDGMHLPFVDAYPPVTDVLMPPFVAFLLGGILAFCGEILRRGEFIAAQGSNVIVFRPLGTVVHVAWTLVPLAAWAAIMFGLLPLLSLGTASTPRLSEMDADSDPVFLIGIYRALAAALTGALAGSLFKKAWYRSAVARLGPSTTTTPFWWQFCYYWRADTGMVSLGAAFLGLTPLMLFLETTTGLTVALLVSAPLMVIGLLTATMYRSTGMPLGAGSSRTGLPGQP